MRLIFRPAPKGKLIEKMLSALNISTEGPDEQTTVHCKNKPPTGTTHHDDYGSIKINSLFSPPKSLFSIVPIWFLSGGGRGTSSNKYSHIKSFPFDPNEGEPF